MYFIKRHYYNKYKLYSSAVYVWIVKSLFAGRCTYNMKKLKSKKENYNVLLNLHNISLMRINLLIK